MNTDLLNLCSRVYGDLDRASDSALNEIPESLRKILGPLSCKGVKPGQPAFTDAVNNFIDAGDGQQEVCEPLPEVKPLAAVEKEEYDLLPLDLWDNKRQTVVPADGYEIDQWDRPHGTGGQGRKRGPLARQKFWRKTKDGKHQFFHGYRLSIQGRRKWVTDRSLSLARFNAERKRDGQDGYF
jgi:hypothetical protein